MTDPAAPTTPERLLCNCARWHPAHDEHGCIEARSTPAEALPSVERFIEAFEDADVAEAYDGMDPAARLRAFLTAFRDHLAARSTPAEALPLRAALERLLAVAMTEEEDVSPATQDEWIAAVKQANDALAAPRAEGLDVEQIVRAALRVVDQTTPLSVGEPLIQRAIAAAHKEETE